MDQTGLAPAGSFCWNPDCPEYAQIGHHNIRKFGRTARGVQRYQCKMCQQTFTETKGTVFHGCHHAPQTILDCLAMLADRNSLAAIHRIKGVKEETVCEWLQRAAQHVEEIEALLLANHPVSRAQLDALWTYVGHKGEKGGHCEEEARGSFWRGTTIEIESRLRIGRAIAKTEEEVALELMTQLKERGHPETPPAMATDGKGSYREAMLETWGQVPEYAGRGRPPTHKRPGADWHYLQVVKERSGSRLVAVHTKVVYGDPQEVKARLWEHTAYVERTHLTSRQMNGRLVRRAYPIPSNFGCCGHPPAGRIGSTI